MYKVLIADDEKNVCMLIKKLINWEVMGLVVIDIVHNAIDAQRFIETRKPDIVITDIKMPGYDGLELIKKSLQNSHKVEFIIISGYKYFEYAHKALGMGVEHYLLKPINKEELELALQKIMSKKNKENKKEHEEEQLREEIYSNQKKMKKRFMTSIISHKGAKGELTQIKEEYQLDFSEVNFQALFIKIDSPLQAGCELSSLLAIMEDTIESLLKNHKCEFINTTMKSGIVTVINYDAQLKESKDEIYEKLLRQLIHELSKFNMFSVTIGIGKHVSSISDILATINSAISAVKCRLKQGVNRLIFVDDLHYKMIDIRDIINESEKRKLENLVEALDCYAFQIYVENAWASIKRMPFYSPIAVFDLLEEVSKSVIATLNKNKIEEINVSKLEEKLELVMDNNTIEETMVREFINTVLSCLEELIQSKKTKSQLPVRLAKQYIQDHFDEQLNLEDVSNAISLSPAYFSTIFKKEVGINFSDYLISCRMEAAKELLKNTEFSIALVAEKVGYLDSRYFSKLFMKVVGLKPSVYRKLYT